MKANAKRLEKLEAAVVVPDYDDRDLPVFFVDEPWAQELREFCIMRNSESCDPEALRLRLIASLKEALTNPIITEHPRYGRILENAGRIFYKLHREGDAV